MKFLRSIAADLVDKRLLPVVVALVALAIAIPLGASVFSGGSSKPAAVSPGTTISLPKGTPSPAKALEDVAGPQTPKAKHYTKPELNPFRDTAVVTTAPAKAATAAASTKTAASTKAATTTTKTTKTTTKTTKTTKAPAKKTTPKPVTSTPSSAGAPVAQLAKLRSIDSYAVDVKVGDATGTRSLSDLERLSPVPSATDPLAEYLGVAKTGRAADFVLNPGVVATGPGVCVPSTKDCQVIELKPGQTEVLGQAGPNGTPIYQGVLAVTNWGVVSHSSPAAATTARRQESQTGRQLMLAAPQPALEKLVYSVAQGVVTLLSNTVNSVTGLLSGSK
jgi:hypothetical protein